MNHSLYVGTTCRKNKKTRCGISSIRLNNKYKRTMSKTNQVCICCEARDNCPHYDTRRTVCVPIDTGWNSLEPCGLPQPTPVRLIEPVKLNTDWQQVRIQAAIAAMQSYISDGERMALVSKKFEYDDKIISKFIAEGAVMYADALVAELKKGGEQ